LDFKNFAVCDMSLINSIRYSIHLRSITEIRKSSRLDSKHFGSSEIISKTVPLDLYHLKLPTLTTHRIINMNNNNENVTTSNGKKFKPYRNRPSMRQVLLEILGFCLILAAAPAFLGGTLGIFVMYFTLVLGLIGLFAWTRRHAALFAILALCVITLCIINIILRATGGGYGNGQCLPYWSFENNGFFNQFDGNNFGNVAGNNGVNGINGFDNNDSSNGSYRSIWCGDKYMVYIVNAIILILAIPAFVIALSLLMKRRNVNTATTTTQTKTTKTFATA